MTTMIMDELRKWRADAATGPQAWQDAWDRTIELLDPLWHTHQSAGSSTEQSDAGAALATALYILAAERGVPPRQISRVDVEELENRPAPTATGLLGYPADLPERWSARLTALGHDLEAEDDPVAVCWRQLRIDYPEPPDAFIDAGDTSLFRVGPAVIDGIGFILGPIHRDRLQF